MVGVCLHLCCLAACRGLKHKKCPARGGRAGHAVQAHSCLSVCAMAAAVYQLVGISDGECAE